MPEANTSGREASILAYRIPELFLRTTKSPLRNSFTPFDINALKHNSRTAGFNFFANPLDHNGTIHSMYMNRFAVGPPFEAAA